MYKDELLRLRKQIVDSAQQIALNGSGSPSERLQILLGIVRAGGADVGLLTKTFEITQQLEADDDKLSALLDLLYEVDADIAKLEPSEDAVGKVSQSDTVPEQQVE